MKMGIVRFKNDVVEFEVDLSEAGNCEDLIREACALGICGDGNGRRTKPLIESYYPDHTGPGTNDSEEISDLTHKVTNSNYSKFCSQGYVRRLKISRTYMECKP
jgi:hypothetical protein